ncbi:MAG TPA: succinate dehydrogenase, hydrophobic membrane anchor protein [Hyphomicrobium sp.]|jgi:succinate dehydrogenase / fumarate reductase membrane anchor subunit
MRDLRQPLARAQGLGSARSGSRHWWLQRVAALALTPLTIWFVLSFTALISADHQTYSRWISSPLNATLMIALLAVLFYHMALGLQVIAEDYLHVDRTKLLVVISIQLGSLGLAIASIVAIIRMLA